MILNLLEIFLQSFSVTEVVWEGEASADDKAEKNVNTTAATASG
jgi:hypothetical protein